MNRRVLVIGGIAVLVVLLVGVGLFLAKEYIWPDPQQTVTGEPVDIVLDFYEPWLTARQSDTDPFALKFAENPVLSKEVRKQIKAGRDADKEFDPVLCRASMPLQISGRLINQSEETAKVLIVSTDKGQFEQSVVTLTSLNDGWYISGISCSPGEFGAEREFSFDREGYLLKSVPPPFDPEYWHLVFVENDQPGHGAPLFFGPESMCTVGGGTPSVCDPTHFVEPAKAHVQGEMTETGVKVKRLELLPD